MKQYLLVLFTIKLTTVAIELLDGKLCKIFKILQNYLGTAPYPNDIICSLKRNKYPEFHT